MFMCIPARIWPSGELGKGVHVWGLRGINSLLAPREAASEMCTAQPCVVVRGSLQDVKDAFLVIEKQTHCKIPLQEVRIYTKEFL